MDYWCTKRPCTFLNFKDNATRYKLDYCLKIRYNIDHYFAFKVIIVGHDGRGQILIARLIGNFLSKKYFNIPSANVFLKI